MPDATSMKNQFLAQVAQIDVQIMNLKDQMIESLQKAVDLDIKTNGSISDITKQFIDTFHFKIENGMVRSEYINYGKEHIKEQRENRLKIQEKKVINQAQMDNMIAEHRKKQAVGNYETLDLSNCIFNNVTFTGNYSDVSFMNSEMEKCSFRNFHAENVLFSKVDNYNSTFDNCSINNSIMTHANIGFSNIDNTAYTNCNFREASFVASNFRKAEFNGCALENAIVSDTHFLDVKAHACTGAETIEFSTYSRDSDKYRDEFDNTFITPDMVLPEHKTQSSSEPYKESEKEMPVEQPTVSKENPPIRQNEKPAYAAYVYVKGNETQKPVRVTGSSAEKIIELCQKWNQERSGDNQLGTAYMQKYNKQTKEYDHIGKFDVKTGNDITPIYLKKLTNLNNEQFYKTTEIFRNNGAKYSKKQKAWYITKQQLDVPAFKDYLPNQPGSKTNVHDSLDRNKSRLENSSQQKHHESRKKDGPAL